MIPKITRCFLLFFLFAATAANARKYENRCSAVNSKNAAKLARTTNLSILENLYDVHYVKINLAMTNTGTTVGGNTTTTAQVVAASGMSQYAFELTDSVTIDSIKFNGSNVTAQSNGGGLRTITLGSPLALNATFTAQVFYHGTPPSGVNFFVHGLVHNTLASGTQITYTMSDPYLASDWWPCKQSLQDKIDSADIWITVPNTLKAGCNGVLTQITPVSATQNRYEWKTRYPIDYYLISASVAPYVDYTRMLHFSNSNDSMPVVHYLYDTATNRALYKSMVDSTGLMVDYFSTLYGRYPFWKEKYGHSLAPLSGGMEHQTMTTIGANQTPLIAHELGHQWWGDHVTYSTWRDIWLSEGWASYNEQLYVEHFWNATAAMNYRTPVFNRVMTQIGGAVYVDDTTDVNRIFDSRLTYDKGAAVAHMLRFLAPDDNTFFTGLRNYQQQFSFRNAVTSQFQAVMEQAYGSSLDTFFRQWVYEEGYPTYSAKWNQAGNSVFFQLTQTTSKPASVAVFFLPVEIKFTSAQGDTVVKFYNNQAQQFYGFSWNKTVTGIIIDPYDNIVNRKGTITQDPKLGVALPAFSTLQVFPNPAHDQWNVAHLPAHTTIQLTDMAGKLIWQTTDASDSIVVPAKNLVPGQYLMLFYQSGKLSATKVLQRN